MTQAFHSQLNTWILSAGTGLAGFIAYQVWTMNGVMSAHTVSIQNAAEQVKSDESKVDASRVEILAKVDGLQRGQNDILIAIAELKRPISKP